MPKSSGSETICDNDLSFFINACSTPETEQMKRRERNHLPIHFVPFTHKHFPLRLPTRLSVFPFTLPLGVQYAGNNIGTKTPTKTRARTQRKILSWIHRIGKSNKRPL